MNTMLRILGCVCLLALLVQAQGHVDYNDCEEIRGGYGQTAQCNGGFVAVNLCTSGRNADCRHANGDAYTVVTCCRINGAENVQACSSLDGGYGVHLSCSTNQAVTHVCSSGRNGDCGSGMYTRISCCDGIGLSVSDRCVWSYGNYGATVQCGADHVIAGVCSSGRSSDCNSNYTGIRCCQLE